MRKPYSSPNYDDPVEYLTRPFYDHATPTAKVRTPTSPITSFTMTITVDFGQVARRFAKDHSEDRHD